MATLHVHFCMVHNPGINAEVLWPVSSCQQPLGRMLWPLSKTFYANCLATWCGALLPGWKLTFIAAFAVNWHRQGQAGKDLVTTVEGLQVFIWVFFSPMVFRWWAYVAKATKPGEQNKLTRLASLGNVKFFAHFNILKQAVGWRALMWKFHFLYTKP